MKRKNYNSNNKEEKFEFECCQKKYSEKFQLKKFLYDINIKILYDNTTYDNWKVEYVCQVQIIIYDCYNDLHLQKLEKYNS